MDPETELTSMLLQTTLQRRASEALLIPEIVSNVFRLFKQDRKTLRTVASVNMIWFQEATRLLWKVTSSTALIAVEESRRNIYALKIRELTVLHASCHQHLRHCNFASLRALSFASGAHIIEPEVSSQYMRPTLEEISFVALPPDGFLYGLNQHCQRLRVFVQSLPSVKDRPDFAGFLTKNQSLRNMRIVTGSQDDAVSMFRALSKMPYLQYLHIVGETPKSALRQFSGPSSEKSDCPGFRNTLGVELTVGLHALQLLRPTFDAMRSLVLDILIETENHELDALAHLPLESLQLHIAAGVRFSSRELLFLSDAKKLQSLTIKPNPWSPTITMPKLEISNEHFEQIFAKLPALKKLLIWFEVLIRDPDTALIDLGQSCPKLENLRIYFPVNLNAWESIPAPLFPNLTFAWIALVDDQWLTEEFDESIVQALAVLVDLHAPRLDRFVAVNSYAYRPTEATELSKYVMRAHGRIKEISQTRHAKDGSI